MLLAGMLAITQKLAFRRQCHLSQTLNSLHDQSSSWLGFISAFGAIFSFGVIQWRVVPIFLYLACMAVLGITTPSLVNFTSIVQSNFDSALSYNFPLSLDKVDSKEYAFAVFNVELFR